MTAASAHHRIIRYRDARYRVDSVFHIAVFDLHTIFMLVFIANFENTELYVRRSTDPPCNHLRKRFTFSFGVGYA